MDEKTLSTLPPGLPPVVAYLVEFDEPGPANTPQEKQHLRFDEPEGPYADCATPLISALAAQDLGYGGWIPLSKRLPRFMSGYIALLHPDKDEPVISYVGTHPGDFREDGYTHFQPLGRIPLEHQQHRRRMRSVKS